MLQICIAFLVRLSLVALFMPFSALDKALAFDDAVAQARETFSSPWLARTAIALGFAVELVMSIAVLSGYGDRLAALVLAGYCVVTALLWKAFWRPGDFWVTGTSRARGLFWDFWKNVAVAGGFLLITFGTGASSVDRFLADPLASSHPYSLGTPP